jgi:hypothetical protein
MRVFYFSQFFEIPQIYEYNKSAKIFMPSDKDFSPKNLEILQQKKTFYMTVDFFSRVFLI